MAMIDTGCPVLVGLTPFEFLGKTYPAVADYFGVTVENLSRHVGFPIDFLVGTDVLREHPWTLDWEKSLVTFHTGPRISAEPLPAVLPLGETFGVPTVPFRAAGFEANAILDSGAPLQFCPKRAVAGLAPVREQEDFFPNSIGKFTTPVFRLPVEFAGERFESEFGFLPQELQAGLEFAGIEWILGYDVLRRRPMTFDLSKNRLFVHERRGR
jgi:hypothetical protein